MITVHTYILKNKPHLKRQYTKTKFVSIKKYILKENMRLFNYNYTYEIILKYFHSP